MSNATAAPITKTRVCAGEYRYMTPLGNFGVSRTTGGWVLAQYTAELGTVEYGTFDTQGALEEALIDLFA